ncbi:MAG: hypothetical protein JRD89_16825 [Deltaproteobacteria bacterium]|nr:hypothetical protein [Deltaproteobacteria bacterium]
MLIHLTLFCATFSILLLILAIREENIIFSVLAMVLSFTTSMTVWPIEIPHAEFVNGAWETTYQTYEGAQGLAYFFFLLGIVALLNFVYLSLETFRRSGRQ